MWTKSIKKATKVTRTQKYKKILKDESKYRTEIARGKNDKRNEVLVKEGKRGIKDMGRRDS